MKSVIADMLHLKFRPVAVIWSDTRPENALSFVPGRRGCLMSLFAQAARGRTAAVSRETSGGIEGFSHFLSNGIRGCSHCEELQTLADKIPNPEIRENFLTGEGYRKTPELVKEFIGTLPVTDIPATYVLLKSLPEVQGDEIPQIIVFIANPHQVSALITLANYRYGDLERVIIPASAGCHQVMLLPYREMVSENPRAVLGLTDPSARRQVMHVLGDDVVTFAVPFCMFKEMEADAPGSFLSRKTWNSIVARF
ncbi:MAG: DUF169 domain-containing protein [Methanoregulaceae archaeon]|nr:DUF169 domain-containing protein [Methanoregulaceae archaeon]